MCERPRSCRSRWSLLRADLAAMARRGSPVFSRVPCAPNALRGASTPRDARRATLGQGHPSRAGSFRSELPRFRRSCLPAGVPLGPPQFLECHARRTAPRCARHPTARSARRAVWMRIAAPGQRAAASRSFGGVSGPIAKELVGPNHTRGAWAGGGVPRGATVRRRAYQLREGSGPGGRSREAPPPARRRQRSEICRPAGRAARRMTPAATGAEGGAPPPAQAQATALPCAIELVAIAPLAGP